MNDTIDRDVLALLNSRRGEWKAVAEASGVSYSWLSKFANGHIGNPGLATLKKLQAALQTPALPAEKAAA